VRRHIVRTHNPDERIFAVAMMFIDQTIVALAVPDLQEDLSLSATGAQWIITGYLPALAALFMLGARRAALAEAPVANG
jgi:MFS family permease